MDNELIQKIDIAIADVSNAYKKIQEKGGTIPGAAADQTTANLPGCISGIPTGGTTVLNPLNDTFTVTKLAKIYTKTPPTGTGYNSVTLNVNVSNITVNKGVDLDLLTDDEYTLVESDSSKFITSSTINLNTKYKLSLEFNKADFANNTQNFAIPFGLAAGTEETENYNMKPNENSANVYTVACLMTAINPALYSKLPLLLNNDEYGIYFRYIDYNINGNVAEVANNGHVYIPLNTFKEQVNEYSDLCTYAGTCFTECNVYGNKSAEGIKINTLENIKGISRIRICTDINMFIPYYPDVENTGLFTSSRTLTETQKAVTSNRISSVKGIIKTSEFISKMNDIIYEVPTRYALGFEPAALANMVTNNEN